MRIDDLAADIAARNSTYVAALSTAGVPLVTITSAMIITREYREPTGNVMVFLDPQQEEVEEHGPSFRIVKMDVHLYVFTQRNTEAVLRAQAENYAQALLNCLTANPYFFGIEGREYFDGVEGNENIKAAKIALVFKYEEAA